MSCSIVLQVVLSDGNNEVRENGRKWAAEEK
jgi:hypothetical protein